MKPVIFAALMSIGLGLSLGCEKVGSGAMPPSVPQTETAKPERVAAKRVAVAAFSEITHLERAMKPYFGLEISSDATKSCRNSVASRSAIWETKWNCLFREATSGRKEIEGTESADLNPKKTTLTYDARFETRIFDDNEPADKAHTVLSTRKMKITFDRSSAAPTSARFTISSRAFRKNATRDRRGSNWTMSISGLLNKVDGQWYVAPGARIVMNGALFGDDGDRLTMWASGDFTFTSKDETRLSGLSTSSVCTIPEFGTWDVRAVGGGESFDTEIELSKIGVRDSAGPFLNWPYDFCERP